jgi:hypothetical protein
VYFEIEHEAEFPNSRTPFLCLFEFCPRVEFVHLIFTDILSLFVRLISHQPVVLFSQNKPATSNQPAVLFPQNKSAPAISHQPNEQAAHVFCLTFLLVYTGTIALMELTGSSRLGCLL